MGKFDVRQGRAEIGLRIAGGDPSFSHPLQRSIPWQVALVERNTKNLQCGGTIICNKYVLTAGLCTITDAFNHVV